MDAEVRMGRAEDKLEVVLDRLAEHISQCHEDRKTEIVYREKIIRLESVINLMDWKEVGKIDGRVEHLEKVNNSNWGIIAPIISTLIGGVIVWAVTQMVTR